MRGIRSGSGVFHGAGKDGRAIRIRPLRRQPRAAVVVRVAVGEQAQSRGRAHLQQRQRLRQPRERRQQRGAARRLVGLRAPGEDDRADLVRVLQDELLQVTAVARGAEQVPHRGKDEVGLLLRFRQRRDERQRRV
jgi:hypothetical protein